MIVEEKVLESRFCLEREFPKQQKRNEEKMQDQVAPPIEKTGLAAGHPCDKEPGSLGVREKLRNRCESKTFHRLSVHSESSV